MTTDTHPILVLGGTGKTGRPLVAALRKAGRAVRAASRRGETRFDWSDRSGWAPALEGVGAVYLLAPPDPELAPLFVREAVRAGARRLVALSGRGADRLPAPLFRSMDATERAVRESGVEWSVIRPNNFDQNFDDDLIWRAPLRAGRLALPTGGTPEPFVDVRDVAEVAAALLTGDGHHGRVYELSGPRALTFAEAVGTMARAAGRPIAYEDLSPEAYRAELRAQGLPEEAVEELDVLFEAMRTGEYAVPADGVQRVLGREPVDFAVYADRAAAAGAWS
ncbi:NAD(P)H-binding protein [Streptomyces sp. JNUCC 64]